MLTIVDVGGNQSGDCLLYNARDTDERYSVPDTIAWSGNVYVRTGTVLRSNEGNPLATVVANEIDRQDTIGGACGKESNTLRYGHHTAAEHGCRENFLAEAARYGMGARDLVSNLNWFMNVPIEADGTLGIVDGISGPGKRVAFRAEMDILVLVSNCPQMNNPCNDFNPTPLRMIVTAGAWRPDSVTSWAFDTVLIANRGEIARRVIRTARRLGLRTVAVYSTADLAAPHVREADEAVLIGQARPQDSYLNECAILSAAKSSGAGAIHPGYGFLSENAGFARQVEEAGLAFVGPTPAHLEAFGAKHTARELARAAGVPLMAGTGLLASAEEAVAAAREIGFPVMVKATGGGGGIGMRACHDAAEVADAFARGPAARQRQLRRPAGRLPRAARAAGPARGGPGLRRRDRAGRGARRPGLLAAAPQPEGHRGGPGPRAAAGAAPPAARRGARPRRVRRLPLGRDRRVRVRPGAAGGVVP